MLERKSVMKGQMLAPEQELLFEACRELNNQKAVLAIEKGADVNAMAPYVQDDTFIFSKENLQFSPLSLVAMHGKSKLLNAREADEKACEIANLLLNHGANIDVLDTGDMGNSPLHWAIVTFKNKLCKLFIQHAMSNQKNVINLLNQPARDNYGSNPPLILALKVYSQYLVHNMYNLDIAELLIAAGADVNAVDHQKQSVLHWAAILRLPEAFFNLLMEKEAHYFQNKYGKTPKELYETELKESLIDISKCVTSFTELGFHIIDWDEHPMSREMHRSDALSNRNKNHQSGIVDVLSMFDMSFAADQLNHIDLDKLNEQDHMGRTRLHTAVFYAKVEEVQKLLALGCDATIKDESGLTALELAQRLQEHFTLPVSPTLFSGEKKFIRAAQCDIWRKIEGIIYEHS